MVLFTGIQKATLKGHQTERIQIAGTPVEEKIWKFDYPDS